jgi:uncharacterized membrane protein
LAIGTLKSRFFDDIKLAFNLGYRIKYRYLPVLVLVMAFLLSSCASNKNSYPYKKKRKKKKCDCPEWSYKTVTHSTTETFVLS